MKKRKKYNKHNNNRENGYVLIDVLATLLILSIVITAILNGFALLGRAAGFSWQRAVEIIVDRNEFEKIPRVPGQE
jgi:type II secretory pathway pseudopilin PulG